MRILFVLKETVLVERLGVMALIAESLQSGHDARLVLVEHIGVENLQNLMREFEPQIVGYSVMTGEHIRLSEVNQILKTNFNFLAVFGGPHATFQQDLVMEEGVDAICVGEADLAFQEFCRRVESKERYWETPNFHVKYEDEIIRNPLMPLLEDLDILPYPNRELMYRADPELAGQTQKMFFSTRGCPYKCSYCFNVKLNEIQKDSGSVLRHRSPQNLVNEMMAVKSQYGMNSVWIEDDIFLAKPRGWLEEFSNLYREHIDVPFSINLRANAVNERNIPLLAKAGLSSALMGVECGNEELANNVLQRNMSNKRIIAACEILKRHGVMIRTLNMVGLPVKNSYQVDLETLDFNILLQPVFAWSSVLHPFPGTPIEAYARTNGFMPTDGEIAETINRNSMMWFGSAKEKRRVQNLARLFGLLVEFPVLRPYVNFLCSLPFQRLYSALFFFWYGYNMKFRFYPMKNPLMEIWKYLRFWWRIQKRPGAGYRHAEGHVPKHGSLNNPPGSRLLKSAEH